MTGRAAACASRWSSSSSRWWGSTERAMASASAQPGRIGSGVTVRASSSEASTDLVVGTQHRRGDRAGGQVDHTGQLGPARHPVIQQHHDVERGGVDLHQLARAAGGELAERDARDGWPATGGSGPSRSCAGPR